MVRVECCKDGMCVSGWGVGRENRMGCTLSRSSSSSVVGSDININIGA
jgi:hypothetical protein